VQEDDSSRTDNVQATAAVRSAVTGRRRPLAVSAAVALLLVVAGFVAVSGGPAATPSAAAAAAEQGTFSVLSYNVAGLPEPLSGSDPDKNTPLISPRLGAYDVVHVQEDFNYHDELYGGDDHPYRTKHSGIAGFGSGLNTLSDLPYDEAEFDRVKWDDCNFNAADCLTPKGFTFMRVRVAEGTYVDFYNVHADAGDKKGDREVRASNYAQLTEFIKSRSAGNAVVVMGDTNARYYTEGESIHQFVADNGLSDAWVTLENGGTAPPPGSPKPTCETDLDDCESIDKVLFRGSKLVSLTATDYRNDRAAFLDEEGERLSDHDPITVGFSWTRSADLRLGETFGGPHGGHFNDVDKVASGARAAQVGLRAGKRVDQVGLTLRDGTAFTHGGDGGTPATLALGEDEYVSSVRLCQGKRKGDTRIFYAQFATNLGNHVEGGTATSDCVTHATPDGWQIAGFHGRSGKELDKVGFVYTRRG
jgi:endonuclease/exonuclease/phosphatase family metal-dependent hydrolase